MDGDAGGGDPDARRRSGPFAGGIHVNLGGRSIGPVTVSYAETALRREAADRRREEAAERGREAARRRRTKSRRPASSEAASGTGTCVRQSILYSDRPRRSRGRQEQSSKSRAEEDASGSEICSTTAHMRLVEGGSGTRLRQSAIYSNRRGKRERVKAPVDKDVSKMSSSELGPTVSDVSKFETLSLNESMFREPLYNSDSEEETEEELRRKLKEYYSGGQHVCTDMGESFRRISAAEHARKTARAAERGLEPPRDPIPRDPLPRWESLLVGWDPQLAQAVQQAFDGTAEQTLPIRQQRSEVTMENIVHNGKKWMGDEVMKSFKDYIERKADEGLNYHLELSYQCFNVISYHNVFHHYNFLVKTKKRDSDDWSAPSLYFAEVKMMFGKKFYFCCPLETDENGHCYACNNQGISDLKHPATGGFERGLPDTVFPYMYTSD